MKFTELRYQDARTQAYLGSPSITRAPDGAFVAVHDYFGPGCPMSLEHEECLTSVYRSEDHGATWRNITHIGGAFWSTLFTHRGALWLLGTSQEYGSIVIRRSSDGGYSWTQPRDEKSGLLFRGGAGREKPNYHGAPVPVAVHRGRIYRAFEEYPVRGMGYLAHVISAPEDADLLDASAWVLSDPLGFHPDWERVKRVPRLPKSVWLEGNVVVTPAGGLVDIIRLDSPWATDTVAVMDVSPDGRTLSFNPETGFVPFPGGHAKFTIRRDPQTGLYLSLVNPNYDAAEGIRDQRNHLALSCSADLKTWRIVTDILACDCGWDKKTSAGSTGFQYADWVFDGPDIAALVRTGYGTGADRSHTYHDSNRITFHRIADYARLLGTRARA
jgi:hypothetical protein